MGSVAVRLVLLLCWGALAAFAPARAAEVDAALDQQVRRLATQSVRAGMAGVSRVEIALGDLDPRLRLAPCQQVEPYLPSGVRLWGKARIGLRCTRGPSPWNVYLPITVKAWGHALVATAVLPAGSVLAATDVIQAEVDLAEEASMAIHETPSVIGRTLVRALLPGQSLRQAHLKPRQWFAAGEQVQVLARGPGFSVAGAAEALTAGIEGRSARVRTEGGRVLVGLPVAENRIELPL
jgi:flagella basal body P-ring formation protein FlgA